MPGVTSKNSWPKAARNGLASMAEHTTPSKPEACANEAKSTTCSAIGFTMPTSRASASSMLVSTVTPINKGLCAQFATASTAASIMRRPPEACMSTIHTPMSAATLQADATVLGMSWYFKSKNNLKPWLTKLSAKERPVAVNNSLPIFTWHCVGSSWRTNASVASVLSKSSATMTGVGVAAACSGKISGFIISFKLQFYLG